MINLVINVKNQIDFSLHQFFIIFLIHQEKVILNLIEYEKIYWKNYAIFLQKSPNVFHSDIIWISFGKRKENKNISEKFLLALSGKNRYEIAEKRCEFFF